MTTKFRTNADARRETEAPFGIPKLDWLIRLDHPALAYADQALAVYQNEHPDWHEGVTKGNTTPVYDEVFRLLIYRDSLLFAEDHEQFLARAMETEATWRPLWNEQKASRKS